MIQNVNKGEKITADNQNKVIDAVNGFLEGSFTNGLGGAGRQRSLDSYSTMFQIKYGKGHRMTERPNTYADNLTDTTWMLIGSDIATFKTNAGMQTTDKVWLIHSYDNIGGEITDSWIKRNGSDTYYDGWIDLQYSKYTPVYCIYTRIVKKDTQTPVGNYFVIDSATTRQAIESDIINALSLTTSEYECKTSYFVCIAKYTAAGHMPGDSGSGPNYRALTQMHTGAILAGSGGGGTYYADTELSDTKIQSIDKKNLSSDEYFQIYDFNDNYNQVELKKDDQDLIVRTRNPSSTIEGKVEYIKMTDFLSAISSISGDSQNPDTDTYSIEVNDKYAQLYEFDGSTSTVDKDRHDVLVRYNGTDGKKRLQYVKMSDLSTQVDLDDIVGDSHAGSSSLNRNTYSIEAYDDGDQRVLRLWNFDADTHVSPNNSQDILVRYNSTNDKKYLYYVPISSVMPHLCADYKSIDINNYNGISAIQLHNFSNPYHEKYAIDIPNSGYDEKYVNLANGQLSGADFDDQFLVRTSTGELVYRRIYADTYGIWDEARIQAIEQRGLHLSDETEYIRRQNEKISSDVAELSGKSNNYWVKGGGASDCYGSEIGDGSGAVIDLTGKELIGAWSSDQTFTAGSLIGNQSIYTGGSLRAENEGWFGGQVWSSSKIWCGGNLETESQLKIGNTTLNETQLQQLLALLS